MGRIPGFSSDIFTPLSLPYLNLTATIALVLFLFLVGLEIDLSTMNSNLRRAGWISFMGMIIPFGLGAAVSVPIYNNFVEKDLVTFGHFMLFTCVAMSITAFPGELVSFCFSLPWVRVSGWFGLWSSRLRPGDLAFPSGTCIAVPACDSGTFVSLRLGFHSARPDTDFPTPNDDSGYIQP